MLPGSVNIAILTDLVNTVGRIARPILKAVAFSTQMTDGCSRWILLQPSWGEEFGRPTSRHSNIGDNLGHCLMRSWFSFKISLIRN